MSNLIEKLTSVFYNFGWLTITPVVIKSEDKISFRYEYSKDVSTSGILFILDDNIRTYFKDKIFQGQLGFYEFTVDSIESDNNVITINLSYKLLQNLRLYFDLLPKEILVMIISNVNGNIWNNEEKKLFDLLGVSLDNVDISLLIQFSYPLIYNELIKLNLSKFIDFSTYNFIRQTIKVEYKNIVKLVDEMIEYLINMKWITPPISIATLILSIDKPWIYSIVKKDEFLYRNIVKVFEDVYALLDPDASPHSTGIESVDDAVSEYIYSGQLPSGCELREIVDEFSFEMFEDSFIYWIFILAMDSKSLNESQKSGLLAALKGKDTHPSLIMKYITPKEYSFEKRLKDKFDNK